MYGVNILEWFGAILVCLIVGAIFTSFIDWLSYTEND